MVIFLKWWKFVRESGSNMGWYKEKCLKLIKGKCENFLYKQENNLWNINDIVDRKFYFA